MNVARGAIQDRLVANDNYKRWVLLTALAGMFATTFPVTLLAVSLSTIADDFDTTETRIEFNAEQKVDRLGDLRATAGFCRRVADPRKTG